MESQTCSTSTVTTDNSYQKKHYERTLIQCSKTLAKMARVEKYNLSEAKHRPDSRLGEKCLF